MSDKFEWNLFEYEAKVREEEKNNLPVWIVLFLICFTKFSLRSSAMRVKFSQTYKKNNFFIWGRLFFSSSLIQQSNRINFAKLPDSINLNDYLKMK